MNTVGCARDTEGIPMDSIVITNSSNTNLGCMFPFALVGCLVVNQR